MNYSLEILKLEKIKQEHLVEIKYRQQTVAKISETIKNYERINNELNGNSLMASRILKNHNKQNLAEILLFFMYTFKTQGEFKNIYQEYDLKELMKIDNFFDFTIINLGEKLIDTIMSLFEKVEEDKEGVTCLVIRDGRRKMINLGAMINKKITNKKMREFVKQHINKDIL